MRKISYSLIGLAFVATAAHAQPVDDGLGELPAPDAAIAEPLPADPLDTVPGDALPETVPNDALPPEPAPPSDPLADDFTTADSAIMADATFSDAEIDSFAAATVEVQRIDADTTLDVDTKQSQMAAAVTEAGLDPAKYNEIGQALATDVELRAKVQTAMSRHASPTG